jgi:hypothetical protein
MTSDDITRMTREAGFHILQNGFRNHKLFVMNPEHMAKFAALVAAAEREECAKVCDKHKRPIDDPLALVGQYESGSYITAEFLADAIRARGAP